MSNDLTETDLLRAAFRDLHGARLYGFALLVTQGDRFVMAFGSPVGQRTPTNAISVIAV